jgi:hypothetical protein
VLRLADDLFASVVHAHATTTEPDRVAGRLQHSRTVTRRREGGVDQQQATLVGSYIAAIG